MTDANRCDRPPGGRECERFFLPLSPSLIPLDWIFSRAWIKLHSLSSRHAHWPHPRPPPLPCTLTLDFAPSSLGVCSSSSPIPIRFVFLCVSIRWRGRIVSRMILHTLSVCPWFFINIMISVTILICVAPYLLYNLIQVHVLTIHSVTHVHLLWSCYSLLGSFLIRKRIEKYLGLFFICLAAIFLYTFIQVRVLTIHSVTKIKSCRLVTNWPSICASYFTR